MCCRHGMHDSNWIRNGRLCDWPNPYSHCPRTHVHGGRSIKYKVERQENVPRLAAQFAGDHRAREPSKTVGSPEMGVGWI
jgi:hypothetical protein